ncbi:autotransporter outer membrane beta-barrel domain-containing protein [Polynucleobacter sp. Tro8-14-1]|uniref:beta strand repeat-containing protein n=1 Tax=Polynucleobacter sp. Tro8-14-1 TaxID=1758383 RepID=UPI001C0CF1D7|nr:autotransporter outer membrane beta-barrel domain-containing protein [Polynucleobacter sp. Tro8-14-1]MBU3562929.1 hypothetical protein [Polynucleobacter sp. Tro8-14-1]
MKLVKIYLAILLVLSSSLIFGVECDPTQVISSSCSITRNDLGTYTPNPSVSFAWDGGSINVSPAGPINFNNGTSTGFWVGPTVPASVGSLIINSNSTIDIPGNPIYITVGNTVDTIVNNGTLNSSGDITVSNGGTINNFTNNGTISSSGDNAINSGTIINFTNNGTISSSAGLAITQITTINNLVNTGTISSSNSNAIMLLDGSTIGSLNNSGIIQGSSSAIYFTTANFGGSAARIDALVNSGTIQALNGNGIDLNSGSISSVSSIGVLTNTGTILGGVGNYAISVDSLSAIQTLNNLQGGTISGSSGDGLNNSGTITNLNNAGLIRSFGSGGHYGVINSGTINNLNNSGTLSGLNSGLSNSVGATISVLTNANGGSIGGGGTGITNAGDIGVLINNGQISSAFSTGLSNTGTVGALTNIGSIRAPFGNMISNSGTITSLNNAQGTGDTTPLTYTRNLPQNYNIILGSTANTYGKLAATSVTSWDGGAGTTNFGIYSGLVKSTSYLDVISGVSASLFTPSSLTGNYGGYQYNLVLEAGTSGTTNMWDLLFPAYVASSNIVTSSGNYLSAVGNTLNPVFAGGTLTLLNGDNSNQAFAVNSSGGTITSPSGGSATLSGAFSGPGAMTFNGTGTTYMNGVNTYTGGTTVAGGTLSVGSSEANNAARLAGDVTVQAAGALAGHGGIGGNVTNNGRVAPGGSIGTLSVAGNYTQNSGGTLSISITPTANSVLAVGGTASVAGGFTIDASSGTYAKKTYTVLTSAGLTGKFSNLSGNLASYSSLNSSLSYDANNAYLTLSAGTGDTQQSLVNTASVLQGIYTLQNTVLANSFSYDCAVFGANNVCISAGGRSTAVQAEGINNTSGLLIAAYRPHANYRIGAYADQNLSTNSPGGTVKLGNSTPLIGLFGAWNERLDGTGTEVKVSAAYGQKNATVTRSVVGTSDPGTGSSNLISQGAQIQAKYGFAVLPEVIVSPYVGMRYTQNNMGGYTEGTSSTVTAPLTYSALNTNATTALAGLGASYRFIPKATVYASAGVETDTNTANGTYSATGVTGLTPINFNTNPVKTRPTATIGAYYDVEKNQRLGINGIYRQEPFQAVSTTSVMATYTIGM